MTDPRNDPPLGEPVTPRSDSMWGWIAGIAVLVAIAIILIAGWNSPNNSDSTTLNPNPAATTGSAVAPIPTSPTSQPAKPATPAPTK